jgi:tetratricopeptide (TPR) repeat protein
MLRNRGLALGVAAGLVAAAAVPATAPAADVVRSIADLSSQTDAPATLDALKPAVCQTPAGGRAPRPGSASKAIRSGEQFLARTKSRSKLRKALHAKGLRRPAGAEVAAMGAVGGAKGGAGLAATLAALGAHPRDVTLLNNASVLLTELGKPKESLALAQAALSRSHGSGAMGIDRRALALNNKAFALIALRRYADAVAPLNQAITRDALLAEARRNLVVALLCSGQDARAAAAYPATERRRNDIPNVSVTTATAPGSPPTELPGSKQPKVDEVLDLSHGEQAMLPALTVPPDPRAGRASADALDAAYRQRNQESNDLQTQANGLQVQAGSDPREFGRIATIQGFYTNWLGQRPDLASQFQQLDALRGQMDQMYSDTWIDKVPAVYGDCVDKPTQMQVQQCFQTSCRSAIDSAHSQWLPVASQANDLAHQWGPALFNYGTAVAANLRNQAAHDQTVLIARSQVWGFYSVFVMQRVAAWAEAEAGYDECLDTPTTVAAETGEASEPFGIACPPQLNTLPITFNVVVVKVTINCESISASTGTPGPAGVFASVGYKFHSAQTTAFVGVRAGADQIPGFNVGAKGGIYMTWDGTGKPTDCGLRVTGSAGTVIPLDLGPSASGKLEVSLAGTFL